MQGSLEEWLQILRLEEYLPALLDQGYQTVDDVTQLTWEDLEEVGIVKLGHQKKLMLAIKRIKDIKAGKRLTALDTGIMHSQQVSNLTSFREHYLNTKSAIDDSKMFFVIFDFQI